MNFRKISFTILLTAFLASSLFVAGCGGPFVTLGFPLANGNTWTYTGTLSYKIGNQEQPMPPVTFRMLCRQLGGKKNLPFELALEEEGERIWGAQLTPTPKGILNPHTVEIWIPNTIKIGKKWKITVDGIATVLIVRSQTTSTTVAAGTFPTYLVDFRQGRKEHGSFLLDPDVGIIVLNWTSKTPGGESKAHLELSSYTLP